MSILSISRRARHVALATTALVAVSLATPALLDSGRADTSTATPPAVTLVHETGSLAAMVQQTKPAVVTVETKVSRAQVSEDGLSPFGQGTPFDEFFKRFFGDQGIPLPQVPDQNGGVALGLGSGFIIDASGIIVTNNHVIDGASEINVTLDDGTRLPAALVGRDAKTDLAVLRVQAETSLPTVAWGDSDQVAVGDGVVAIGNPFGIGTTVTSGIVSARGRDLHSGPYDDFIQVDAAINRGNSGGPLFDMEGDVVGINTAIYTPNGGNVGVGFAIPSSQARDIVARLIENGSIEHGFLGVSIQPVTDDIAGALGLDAPEGALVANVVAGSPAEAAGLRSGDVITGIDDQSVADPKQLSRAVADMAPGTGTDLAVVRDGKHLDLAVTIGQNPADKQVAEMQQPSADEGAPVAAIGVGLSDLTPDVRQSLGLGQDVAGAVIRHVEPGQAAEESGVRVGDVIVAVGSHKVSSAEEAKEQIASSAQAGRKGVLLLIERNGDRHFVAVPFGHA